MEEKDRIHEAAQSFQEAITAAGMKNVSIFYTYEDDTALQSGYESTSFCEALGALEVLKKHILFHREEE